MIVVVHETFQKRTTNALGIDDKKREGYSGMCMMSNKNT